MNAELSRIFEEILIDGINNPDRIDPIYESGDIFDNKGLRIVLEVPDDIYELLYESAALDKRILFKGKDNYLTVLISNREGSGGRASNSSQHGPRTKIQRYTDIKNPNLDSNKINTGEISIPTPSNNDDRNSFDKIQGTIPNKLKKDVDIYMDFVSQYKSDLNTIFLSNRESDKNKIIDSYTNIAKDDRVIILKSSEGDETDEIYDAWIEFNPNAKNKNALKASVNPKK